MNKILELRLKTGLSQKKFGELIFNIQQRTIQNWELEDRKCPEYVEKLIESYLKSLGY